MNVPPDRFGKSSNAFRFSIGLLVCLKANQWVTGSKHPVYNEIYDKLETLMSLCTNNEGAVACRRAIIPLPMYDFKREIAEYQVDALCLAREHRKTNPTIEAVLADISDLLIFGGMDGNVRIKMGGAG